MEYLYIENFKCFREIEIPINNLTVFAGANGNGKSTAIQALLFMRRSIEHCSKWEKDKYNYSEINGLKVDLNGSYCLALGNSTSIINRGYEKSSCKLGIREGIEIFSIEYSLEESKLWLEPINVAGWEQMKDSGMFNQEFYYLNAERLGPRISQGIQFYDYANTGFQGEYVAQLLGDTELAYGIKIDENRKCFDVKSPRLEQQVNAWLDYLMPGVSVSAKYDPETGSAQIRVENSYTKGESVIATNIGFGISYVLPIIVTGLIAEPGRYLIVENPEAHLHPSAQSKIGRFLSVIANSGVKVIVETHSDHVIHGIQVSSNSGLISSEKVTLNYFNLDNNLSQPNLQVIKVNNMGELSVWPTGFFDQGQEDFKELLKNRKNV